MNSRTRPTTSIPCCRASDQGYGVAPCGPVLDRVAHRRRWLQPAAGERNGQSHDQPDHDPALHGRDRLHHQLERRLDAVQPVALHGLTDPGLAALAAAAAAQDPADPGRDARRRRLAGDHPRRARRRWARSPSTRGSPRSAARRDFYAAARAREDRRAHPRDARSATSATSSSASWSASTRSSGTTCRRGSARPSTSASSAQLPDIVRTRHRRDRRRTSTSCSTSS